MGSVGSKNLTIKDIMDSIAGKDNYMNETGYADKSKEVQSKWARMDELDEERRRLQEELKNESQRKPKDQWTDEDEWMSLIGERPMIYTERGEEINKRLKEIYKEKDEIQKEWQKSADALKKLDERHIDNQKKLYSLRPDSERTVSTNIKDSYEGFKVGESTTSYVDDALKSGKAFVVEMSPKEYLQECAYNIFDRSTLEKTLRGTSASNVKKYMDMMKSGVKFDTPYLNYKDSAQEGRHRAIAAYMLGYKRIPVIVMLPNGRKL